MEDDKTERQVTESLSVEVGYTANTLMKARIINCPVKDVYYKFQLLMLERIY